MNIKAFKFVSNRPTLLIFQFDLKLCDAFAKNTLGIQDIIHMGNVTQCPVKKVTKLYMGLNVGLRIINLKYAVKKNPNFIAAIDVYCYSYSIIS